ncbi:MAG TPA: ABC transporter ATP-binding protein [Thermoclostridium caenicola]|nr:ABC transporter ATP-binding protein [Thermoclostridium caenicola]HOK44077.1 ABC transporter ATP-binding protein [Thermoclostridium caenicola]HOL85472.1 ABC transporter ATP-binding protein [Thermoclostridium caenicola]HPO77638.1 ABC transporter ATP-binding protein [Thermoclostridium caenicola]
MEPLIRFENVTKEYAYGENKIRAADNISFEIHKGEFTVILGPSGAGKSTVLNLLGGMDRVTSGSIYVNGCDIATYDEKQLTAYRRDHIGFVFQFYNLIPTLTVYENVALTKELVRNALDAREILASVGMETHLNKFPAQLSGGEQQRVSIARAICKNPTLLLCDEPTGALDSETGVLILSLLQRMSREKGHTVIIVTHNSALAPAADRLIRLRSGKIVEEVRNPSPVSVEEVNW